VDKASVIQLIIAHLRQSLDAGTSAARASSAAATDPDSRAENKYDTRSLEASYLARGQALRVAETSDALAAFTSLQPRSFGPADPILEGALVELSGPDGRFFCFIGPAAGGTEIPCGDTTVMVVTRSSPLGSRLLRQTTGAVIEVSPGRPSSSLRILSVR
jgi:hypothetical protein